MGGLTAITQLSLGLLPLHGPLDSLSQLVKLERLSLSYLFPSSYDITGFSLGQSLSQMTGLTHLELRWVSLKKSKIPACCLLEHPLMEQRCPVAVTFDHLPGLSSVHCLQAELLS